MSASETSGQVLPFENRGTQLGALDLGSNSFHLLVAQESHGRIQIIDKHKEMVRLAEGLRDDNTLDPAVAKRALAGLARLAQRLSPLDPQNVRIVGTNTLRAANANSDFLEQAQKIVGNKIEIISGREEARLIYLGVCHDLGGQDTRRLVVDIGGGSTEMILGRKATPETMESLYMGCVSMSQRHFPSGKIGKACMERAINDALVELEPIAGDYIDQGWDSAVGASGTINAVSAVANQLGHGHAITSDALADIRTRMVDSKDISKLALPGLSDERRAVFPGGVAILTAIFEALKIEQMAAAQAALREGVIYDLLGRQHQDDARDHTVTSLMQHYRIDTAQARQVRDTAIALLSQVAVPWQLTEPGHRLLVGWAANLHEIGMDISHSGFQKHGGYLLENMDMPGFSRTEQRQLALLVRTHRRKLTDELFAGFSLEARYLTTILRLAAVLHRNRSHDALPHIQATAKGDQFSLSLPSAWLKTRPLTVEDLKQETAYLAAVGITLEVVSH